MTHKANALAAALAFVALLVVGAEQTGIAQTSATGGATSLAPAQKLAAASSWGYQLQKIDPDLLATAPYDVLVIDYSRDGSDEGALTARELRKIKRKPDGGERIVLAYLSIGEAENYRYYWDDSWSAEAAAPSWLGRENKKWHGNIGVKYWDQDWQTIIFSGADSYLERIVRAGFDGVYLDKVDEYLAAGKDNLQARQLMIELVTALAERARALKPGFLVVPQNAEELLADASYRAVIDGLGKEDLLFGEVRAKQPNRPEEIEENVALLKLLSAEGKPVFTVEYLDTAEDIESARNRLEELGFIPHFAKRSLDRMRFGDLPESPRKSSKGVR